MMKLDHISSVYFLGIGGIGMSALARYFKLHGCVVSGYDKTKTPLTQALQSEGIDIHYAPNGESISASIDLVVYTPAVSSENPEWSSIQKLGLTTLKRAEVLGLISNSGKGLAIAGTHGKTTTSGILAHIFKSYFGEVNAFVGGILSNYNTNFLYSESSSYFVVEADEFDRSFLHLNPEVAVINSIDADHLDIYGAADALIDSFKDFSNRIQPGGMLLLNSAIPPIFNPRDVKVKTFGIDSKADYQAQNIEIKEGSYVFDFHYPQGIIKGIVMALPGRHNIENALAACAIATICKIPNEDIAIAMGSFLGVKRRFEITRNPQGLIYVDDYAHHPTEISRVLESAREMYPDKELTVVFQPHLYSRTRDFETEFAQALSGFDQIILLDIYPARELPIEGVSSEVLLEKIKNINKRILAKDLVVDYLRENKFEVLFTLGAGDIDTLVNPIKELVTA